MIRTLTVTDASRNFSDVINRVVYRGETFVLERGGRPVARLVPLPQAGHLGELPGLLDSIPRLGAEDAEVFRRDIEEARESLPQPSGPWPS